MANTYIKINIHLVFHTKSRGIPMRKEDLPRIFEYIGGIIKKVNGIPFMIGGVENHIHVLATLPKMMTLPDFVRTIKANSSRWIKQIDAYYAQFCWQDGYGAFSVSPSLLNIAINYIRNQEEHHKKQTFQEEYRSILPHKGFRMTKRMGMANKGLSYNKLAYTLSAHSSTTKPYSANVSSNFFIDFNEEGARNRTTFSCLLSMYFIRYAKAK